MRSLAPLILMLALACGLPLGQAWSAPPARVVDDMGQTIVCQKPFQRIISLYAAHTENLFALGLGGEVVGVSTHESHPPAALAKPAFGSRDDPERFLAARPDLVLLRPMHVRAHPGLAASLRQAGVTVAAFQPRTVEEMLAYWRKLGALTGRQAQARAMARAFAAGLARLRGRVDHVPPGQRPGVYFESIHRHMKTFAPDSMAVFVLKAAGGRNLAADARAVRATNIAAYGKERIMALASRLDVYLAQVGAMNRVTKRDIMEEPGFTALKAVAQGRVHLVPEELVSRPTPRLLQGVALVQGLLYPELAGR